MKRVYISGPMTGVEDFNCKAFQLAEARLTVAGYEVVSPLSNQQLYNEASPEDTYKAVMQKDLFDLLACDVIAMLPDWEQSNGARVELAAAMVCNMEVIDAITLKELNAKVEYYFTYKS